MTTRQQAIDHLAATIRKHDGAIFAVRSRSHTMRPAHYQRELTEARRNAAEAIKAARTRLTDAIALERQETWRTNPPNAEVAARITMYAAQAQSLANAGMRDLAAGVREQLRAGNRVAAAEYLRAGGSRLQEHMSNGILNTELRQLQNAAKTRTQAKREGLRVGLDRFEAETGQLDWHLDRITSSLGQGDVDAAPDTQRVDPARVISLWREKAETAAVDAALAHAESWNADSAATGAADLAGGDE